MLSDASVLLLDILGMAFGSMIPQTQIKLDTEIALQLYRLADLHKVVPIVYDFLSHSLSFQKLDAGIKKMFEDSAVSSVQRQIQQTHELLSLLNALNKVGFSPIIIKGVVCSTLYPKAWLRIAVDEDLFVGVEQYHRLFDTLLSQDFRQLTHDGEEATLVKDGCPLCLELHTHLFPSKQESYSHLNSYFTDAVEMTVYTDIQGFRIKTLSPHHHLLFLILHAYKHFLHSGFGLRQICDIALYTKAYNNEIDWGKMTAIFIELHLENFVAAIYKIVQVHLRFQFQDSYNPYLNNKDVDEIPLLADILESGLLGNANIDRMHSSNITLKAVSLKENSIKSGLRYCLFPDIPYMKANYEYVNEAPFLLPFAWIHRLFAYLISMIMGRQSGFETIRVGKARVRLLKFYKLF